MAPKKLVFGELGEQEDQQQTLDKADEKPSHESDSDSESEEEEGIAKVPPKKPKFDAPREQVGPEPGENGSECSSPSASGFIIMPAVKQSGKKKNPSSKKFCDEDEIALLKGLAVFWANGRNNKWTEFHHFIKDDLRNQFTKIQVSEKIRALKRKFETNLEKAGANGGRLDFPNPHESLVFELSKTLWGDEKSIAQETKKGAENEHDEANKIKSKRKQVDDHEEENKIPRKRKQVDGHDEESKISRKGKQVDEHDEENKVPENRKQVMEIGNDDFESAYPLLYASFDLFGYPKIVKEKCSLIGREKAQELEEKWRELNAEERRLELKRIDLIKRDLQDHHQSK